MTSKLMNLDQCLSCTENVEFVLKLILSGLQLCGAEFKLGFSNLSLCLTLDGFVYKIDEIEEDEDVVCDLLFQATPTNFNHKLHNSPIMMTLRRGEKDLGIIKINIAECFANAVMCDDFEGQRFDSEYKFIKDNVVSGIFDLVIHVTRKPSECKDVTDFLRKREKAKKKVLQKASSDISMSESLGFTCDDTDFCPLDSEDSEERMTSNSFHPSTSKSNKSKCRSDIATSLDINDFKGGRQTFCHGCGGFSISGVTCENKKALPTNSNVKKKCQIPRNRICSECFEELTLVPHNAPCPKCDSNKKQLSISFKSKKQQKDEQEKIHNCLRSIFEEILLGDKAQVEKDMKRLKGSCEEKKKNEKINLKEICGKSKKKPKNPRCNKIRKILNKTRAGLTSRHPGVVRGHKACMLEASLVPKNMGWLWNVQTPGISKIRRGWKPGAVPRKVAKMMKFFLTEQQPPAEPHPQSTSHNMPGLHVQRKKGDYTIKMNSANGDGPITFKIGKSEEAKKREEARKILNKRGFEKKCRCKKIEECKCISDCIKKEVTVSLKNISTELSLTPELKFSELNVTSESELDFKYTPPIVMTRSKFLKRPPVCNVSTQYEAQKIEEVIIEDKKMEMKKLQHKLQQATKGNSKATKSSLKGGKSAAVKKEGKKKENVKKNIGASSGKNPSNPPQAIKIPPHRELSHAKKVCNACTFNTCNEDPSKVRRDV